jgi:Leucine-rich repeat (LRR) protein
MIKIGIGCKNMAIEELDLHWNSGDPDLGLASDGVLCKDMKDITARISKVKSSVKKINLNNQQAFTEVPAVIGECKLLEELNVSHTNIKALPEFVFTLPNLHFLSCRCREPMELPPDLSKAEKLQKLHFRINKDYTFPEEVTSLKNLKSIAVDLYSDIAFPEKIGVLKNLEKINLFVKFEEGDIPALPASFNKHPSIKRLNIHDPFHKQFKKFDLQNTCKILSSCPQFEVLKLSGVSIGKDHSFLASLAGLKELVLRQLMVEGNIFDSIKGLHNLEVIDIWGSSFKIKEIPDIFTQMKGLRIFSFAGNMITDLPKSIYTLQNLTTLEIGSTGISALDDKIGDLKTLERLQVYDNVLEKIPDAVFSLPKLNVLNIEENLIHHDEIESIKKKIKDLDGKGQKIEFVCEGQGNRQMVKRLRCLKNIDKMDVHQYLKYCFNAVRESPNAVKYVDIKKLHDSKLYAEVCIAAAKKSCLALENVDLTALGKGYYFYICMEAARCPDIGSGIKFIRTDALTAEEYIQVCLEAALHNKAADFLTHFNSEAFRKHFNREIYERICWAAVLHHPQVITRMERPTPELQAIAKKHGVH